MIPMAWRVTSVVSCRALSCLGLVLVLVLSWSCLVLVLFFLVLSCISRLACLILFCLAVVSCHVVPYHMYCVASCLVFSCRVVSCWAVSYRVEPCRVALCRVVSCPVLSFLVLPCIVLSCIVSFCPALPWSCLVLFHLFESSLSWTVSSTLNLSSCLGPEKCVPFPTNHMGIIRCVPAKAHTFSFANMYQGSISTLRTEREGREVAENDFTMPEMSREVKLLN